MANELDPKEFVTFKELLMSDEHVAPAHGNDDQRIKRRSLWNPEK
jgi:hypothetical protein